MSDLFELTRRLVEIPSPTGDELAAADFPAAHLQRLGYRVIRQPVTNGRFNVYAYREAPELVFATHLDTVPPHRPLREDRERIYGRGSCDAKGLAAAMVSAAESLAGDGERRVGLLFVVGEENGSDGAMAAAELEPKGRWLVNGEPTDNLLTIGQKGSLRIDLDARGRAAHSAYPDEGVSAIAALLDTIERIRRIPPETDELLGTSTLNVGIIHGGVAPNVIPAEARAKILIRTVGPTDELRRTIEAQAAPEVDLRFGAEIPAYKGTAPAGWKTTTVSFASDLPFLAPWGRCFQMGPGSIRLAHTDDESIGKEELLEGVELYVRLAKDLMGTDGQTDRRTDGPGGS